MPLATILSGYNLQVLVIGAIGIFTVKFWMVLWYISRWLDDNMIKAMYPDSSTLLSVLTLDVDGGYKKMILNTLMTSLYIGLPIIWTWVMGLAGLNIGEATKGLVASAAHSSQDSAKAGFNAGRGIRVRRG